MFSTIELREADQPELHRLPRVVAVGLAAEGIAVVAPTAIADEYRVSGVRKVGVTRIAGHTVRIRPKTPVNRLFALLGYARGGSSIWTTDDVGYEEHEDLVSALAHAFVRQASRTLAGGPLRGYVTRDDALPLVRGRWRIGDQLTRRTGQPLPVEVSFDDYVEDIVENQVVLSAALRLLRLPGVPVEVLAGLRRIVHVLDGVTTFPAGAPAPVVRMDRRNARYDTTLALATLVLNGSSIEHREGSVVGSGFLVDMWAVFEDFVSVAMREAFNAHPGTIVAQYASTLDIAGTVRIEPDLVWLVGGAVRACIDVKYKVEKRGQYPNADLYQMAAYCRRFGLDEGFLIYAGGAKQGSTVELVDGTRLRRVPLRLDQPLDSVLRRIAAVARAVRSSSTAEVGTGRAGEPERRTVPIP